MVGQTVPSLTDPERLVLHTDILPAQAAQLTDPHAGEQRENDAEGRRLRHGLAAQIRRFCSDRLRTRISFLWSRGSLTPSMGL